MCKFSVRQFCASRTQDNEGLQGNATAKKMASFLGSMSEVLSMVVILKLGREVDVADVLKTFLQSRWFVASIIDCVCLMRYSSFPCVLLADDVEVFGEISGGCEEKSSVGSGRFRKTFRSRQVQRIRRTRE